MTRQIWYTTLALTAALLTTAAGAHANPAAPAASPTPFADSICPNVVGSVQKYDTLLSDPRTTVPDAIAAAKEASDKYVGCSHDRFSEDKIIPSQYASLRAAQFLIAVGHWQHLDDENISARASLQTAIDMLGKIIDWRKGQEISYLSHSNTPADLEDHNPQGALHSGTDATQSPLHDAAVKLRGEANNEILLLAAPISAPGQPPPDTPTAPPPRTAGH